MKEKYTIVNETHYHLNTPRDIIDKLEYARINRRRVTLKYKEGYEDFTGYTKDGLKVHMWIGRSTGNIKIPLHIASTRSRGGAALCTDLIEKIIAY